MGAVNITDPEGGPTVTSMIPEGGTAEKKLLSTLPLHRLINGTALITITTIHRGSSAPTKISKVISRQLQWNNENFDEIHILNGSVRNTRNRINGKIG